MALLLSGAGLAASLLIGVAVGKATVPPLAWKPALGFRQETSGLASGQPAAAQVLPVSLSSMVPTYSFATGPAYGDALPAPTGGYFSNSAAEPASALLPAASTVKMTVQRSWNTFKLAFR